MRRITIVLAMLAVAPILALADSTCSQIMIRAEFIAVPKAVLDKIGRAAPDQLPTAEMILGFKQSASKALMP